MASAIYLEAFVAGLLVTLIFTIYVRPRRDKVPCPPSLKSEFLIGHARVIPLEREWEVFAQWSKELDSMSIILAFDLLLFIHILR